MAIDFLLDENDDIQFDENGEIVLGETTLQEVGIIARLNKGELLCDPLLGPNLVELLKDNLTETEAKQRMKLAIQRDGKNYEELEEVITEIFKDYNGENIAE